MAVEDVERIDRHSGRTLGRLPRGLHLKSKDIHEEILVSLSVACDIPVRVAIDGFARASRWIRMFRGVQAARIVHFACTL